MSQAIPFLNSVLSSGLSRLALFGARWHVLKGTLASCLAGIMITQTAIADSETFEREATSALNACILTLETRDLSHFGDWSQYSDFRWTKGALIAGISGDPEPGSATDRCLVTPASLNGAFDGVFVRVVQTTVESDQLHPKKVLASHLSADGLRHFEQTSDIAALSCQKKRAFVVTADDGAVVVTTFPKRPLNCEGNQ